MARRAGFVAAYLLALALLLEASARLALGTPWFFARVRGDDDASWRLSWVRQHARRGSRYAGVDEYDPTRGWALRPGLRDVPLAGALVSSSSQGLRGRREYAEQKPAGARRVVALGDSFTFGEEVADDDTWCRRLEAALPRTEVLNLGVHGYGHDQMLLYLRERGLAYRPDVVALGFVADDMERNLLRFRDYAKPRFVLEHGRLALRGAPVPRPDEVLRAERWRPRLLDVFTILRADVRARTGSERAEAARLTAALLDEIRSASASAGADALYLYLPTRGELARPHGHPTRPERFFLDYCAQRSAACLDLAPAFAARRAAGDALKAFGHWDAAEHAVAADAIAHHLAAPVQPGTTGG